jgi:riboflavin synthase
VFTGLIEDIGRLLEVAAAADARELVVAPGGLPTGALVLGESIAIDGVCLTVTARDAQTFRVLAGPETLARTTLGGLAAGAAVNLERALRASDRLGGHIVSGHVDAVGTLATSRPLGPGRELSFAAPAALLRYVVEKGSIAVDGISLTVNRVDDEGFTVALIPHTLSATTLGGKEEGSRVNLEADIIGKYVEKLLKGNKV